MNVLSRLSDILTLMSERPNAIPLKSIFAQLRNTTLVYLLLASNCYRSQDLLILGFLNSKICRLWGAYKGLRFRMDQ